MARILDTLDAQARKDGERNESSPKKPPGGKENPEIDTARNGLQDMGKTSVRIEAL